MRKATAPFETLVLDTPTLKTGVSALPSRPEKHGFLRTP